MISAKRLARVSKKWKRMAKQTEGSCGTSTYSSVAGKGCCAVYTADGARFEVPLAYLNTAVFGDLLRMSHEEFGFVGGNIGQITLLCDVAVMVYAMCLLGRSASAEMEAPFLCSMTMSCHYDAALHLEVGQLVAVCSS
ncbi:hypothetical protein BRADI_4g36952v3 [Brachypodium distachyon]|uniref:Auxin-responsive protein n=1 Tax=Brachypodium distachyon TaxID=15368 RepID=A0A2K2CSS3_BRADI|nr:hypothetical protein BRADI_4g36952v3 [Brachypodium distachyon]